MNVVNELTSGYTMASAEAQEELEALESIFPETLHGQSWLIVHDHSLSFSFSSCSSSSHTSCACTFTSLLTAVVPCTSCY